jgi:hypothetical protein
MNKILFKKETANNPEFEDDDDEYFYRDITFDPLSFNTQKTGSNPTINNNYYKPNNINNHQLRQSPSSSPTSSSSSSSKPNESQVLYKNGRVASQAINASAIPINRAQPSPGTQKRPPHLRLNNL